MSLCSTWVVQYVGRAVRGSRSTWVMQYVGHAVRGSCSTRVMQYAGHAVYTWVTQYMGRAVHESWSTWVMEYVGHGDEMPPGHSQCHLVRQNSKQYHPGDDWRAINGGTVATEKTAVVWTCLEDASPSPPETTCAKQT